VAPTAKPRARVGGNPALQPETAKIYTAGVVIQPRWVRGFSATIDYYNIKVEKSISTIGAQLILKMLSHRLGRDTEALQPRPARSEYISRYQHHRCQPEHRQ
jgi:hypothetical protein